jgi:quercetin 2,3-dioxygenase
MVNAGWLRSAHSFSFGHWFDENKMNFGALRVLNDDLVIAGAGFAKHPHSNMEIISIPQKGALAHKDSSGAEGTIVAGDVQLMGAGSGIEHAEMNASKKEVVQFLQIWILPKVPNMRPRYEQKTFDATDRQNKWQTVVSFDEQTGGLWINQDAVLCLCDLAANKKTGYDVIVKNNGVYVFVLEGECRIDGQLLQARDALGVWETDAFVVEAQSNCRLLTIEVPMISINGNPIL